MRQTNYSFKRRAHQSIVECTLAAFRSRHFAHVHFSAMFSCPSYQFSVTTVVGRTLKPTANVLAYDVRVLRFTLLKPEFLKGRSVPATSTWLRCSIWFASTFFVRDAGSRWVWWWSLLFTKMCSYVPHFFHPISHSHSHTCIQQIVVKSLHKKFSAMMLMMDLSSRCESRKIDVNGLSAVCCLLMFTSQFTNVFAPCSVHHGPASPADLCCGNVHLQPN